MLTTEQRKQLVREALDSDDPMAFERLDDVLNADTKEKKSAKAAKKKATGAAIQKQCLDELVAMGWLAIRINSRVDMAAGRYHKNYTIANNNKSAGHSDIVAYKGGRALFIEIKTKYEKQLPSQVAFQAICERHGMTYLIIRTIEELRICLNQN